MQQDNLDDFIMEHGTEMNNIQILDKETEEKKFNDNFHLAYGDGTPIPGGNIVNQINGLEAINEESALDSLIVKSAIIKAEKERAEAEKRSKLTKKDREVHKKQFVDSLMYQQEEEYYQKHHYMMDGKTKRNTRKRIEREFDKGRYDRYLTQNHTSLNG